MSNIFEQMTGKVFTDIIGMELTKVETKEELHKVSEESRYT